MFTETPSIAGIVRLVPATGCDTGHIMWLLDEPNQPYEGNNSDDKSFLIFKLLLLLFNTCNEFVVPTNKFIVRVSRL